jgi:hypothetical protein
MKKGLTAALSTLLALVACTAAAPTATPVVVEKEVLATVEVPVTREVEVTRVIEVPVTIPAEATREIEVPVTVVVEGVVTATPLPTAESPAVPLAIPRLTGGQPVTITLIHMISGRSGRSSPAHGRWRWVVDRCDPSRTRAGVGGQVVGGQRVLPGRRYGLDQLHRPDHGLAHP